MVLSAKAMTKAMPKARATNQAAPPLPAAAAAGVGEGERGMVEELDAEQPDDAGGEEGKADGTLPG